MRLLTMHRTLFLIIAGVLIMLAGCDRTGNDQRVTKEITTPTPSIKSGDSSGSSAESSTCTAAENEKIASQIRVLIDGDQVLSSHRKHINFSTKDCRITLRGWVDSWTSFQKLYAVLNKAGEVRSIDIEGFSLTASPRQAHCPAGTKPCGELCIPNDEDCTIPILD